MGSKEVNLAVRQFRVAINQVEIMTRTHISIRDLAEALVIYLSKEYLQDRTDIGENYVVLDIGIESKVLVGTVWQREWKVKKVLYVDRRV